MSRLEYARSEHVLEDPPQHIVKDEPHCDACWGDWPCEVVLLLACAEALRLHNQTPTGRMRKCLPACVACAALAPLLDPLWGLDA